MKSFAAISIILIAASLYATPFEVSFKNFEDADDSLLIAGPWYYSLQDISNSADPNLHDADWLQLSDTRTLPPAWKGSGWYRRQLFIEPKLRDKTVALAMRHSGDLKLYLDGKLLYEFHQKGLKFELNPLQIRFDEKSNHLLAVFYKNPDPQFLLSKNMPAGFYLTLKDFEISQKYMRGSVYHFVFLCGILLAFAFIHIFIYFSDRREKLHLLFALFCFVISILIFTELEDVAIDRTEVLHLRRLWGLGQVVLNIVFLRFTYMLFGILPKRFYVYSAAGVALLFWGWSRVSGGWISPAVASNYISLHTLIGLLEVIRTFLTRRTEKENILVLGAIPIVITAIYQMFINFGLVSPFTLFLDYVPLPYYAFLVLAFTMSIYLSRNIARTNRDLEKQIVAVRELSEQRLEQERRARAEEIERKLLDADHRRKTDELEEARKLQLSMLPEKVPTVPGLEIAFYMKPATEVGGDYYDFHYDDGCLTIVIGDATGHGVQAGIMVTAVKGLFLSLASNPEIPLILSQISETLKGMRLGRMYMALSLAKYSNQTFRIASAGMPSSFLCRPGQPVEILRNKGIPLGVRLAEYSVVERRLNPGEVVVLMTDGFPETFNPKKEILGYDKVPAILEGVADKSPDEIIHHLVEAGRSWADGAPQDDDITFVVLKAV